MGFTAPEKVEFDLIFGTITQKTEVFKDANVIIATIAEFVKTTSAHYTSGDLVKARATNFTSALKVVPVLVSGDVYIFRTRRSPSAVWQYGLIKVNSLTKPQDAPANSFIDFSFKYGVK